MGIENECELPALEEGILKDIILILAKVYPVAEDIPNVEKEEPKMCVQCLQLYPDLFIDLSDS